PRSVPRVPRRRRDLFLRGDGELLVVPVLGGDLDAASEDEKQPGGALEPRRRGKPDLVVDLSALEIAVGTRLQAGDFRRTHAPGIDASRVPAAEIAGLRGD